MPPTIELDSAIRLGLTAYADRPLTFEEFACADRMIREGVDVPEAVWLEHSLWTDEQREAALRYAEAVAEDVAERRGVVDAVLADLGIAAAPSNGWRTSRDQRNAAPRPSGRRRNGGAAEPEGIRTTDFDGVPVRASASRRRRRLAEQFAPRLLAADGLLEFAAILGELEKAAGLEPEPRQWEVEVLHNGAPQAPAVTVDASAMQARKNAGAIVAAARMKAGGESERTIEAATGVAHSTQGRVLRSV